MSDQVDNPWRESLENCISGDNYLRASEYHELIAELDRGYLAMQGAAALKAALLDARKCVEAYGYIHLLESIDKLLKGKK